MLALFALVAAMQSPPECDDKDGDTAAAVCLNRLGEAADAELNQVWPGMTEQALRLDRKFRPTARRSKPSRHLDLLASQRAWLKYRSEQCALESDWADGGSLQNVIHNRCYLEMTRSRITQLQAIVRGWSEF